MISELAKAVAEQAANAARDVGTAAKDGGKAWEGELPKAETQRASQWEGELPSKETASNNWDGALPWPENSQDTSTKIADAEKTAIKPNEIDFNQECDRYNKEVKETSAAGDVKPIEAQNLEKRSPESLQEARTEFNQNRNAIIDGWEKTNGSDWPRYKEDVYSDSGKLIRRAGDRYDAHHIQPLELGGKNSSENITPMHAKDHYDKQGIHRPGSPYDSITKTMRGVA